jgi:hypothetical protein
MFGKLRAVIASLRHLRWEVRTIAAGSGGGATSSETVGRYPKTVALLLRGEEAIADKRTVEALDLAKQANAAYREESAAMPSPIGDRGIDLKMSSDNDRARTNIGAWRVAITATAQIGAGQPVAGIGELGSDGYFSLAYCRGRSAPTCQSAWSELAHNYHDAFLPDGINELKLYPRATVDAFVSKEGMELLESLLERASGNYVAFAYPDQVQKGKGGALRLAWHGKPGSVMRESCNKIGKLNIEDITFDVSRCGMVKEVFTPATVTLDVAPEDAALLAGGGKGRVVGLLLQKSSLHRSGNTWDLGMARALWMEKARKPD